MLGIRSANHVNVEVRHGVLQRKHRVIGIIFTPQQTLFLAHDIHEQNAPSRPKPSFAQFQKLSRQFHHGDRPRPVVVCAVVHFSIDDAHVVVV